MFLPNNQTMEYVRILTEDPSDRTIKEVIREIQKLLPDDFSVDSQLEPIMMAVEPVHPGTKERLYKIKEG